MKLNHVKLAAASNTQKGEIPKTVNTFICVREQYACVCVYLYVCVHMHMCTHVSVLHEKTMHCDLCSESRWLFAAGSSNDDKCMGTSAFPRLWRVTDNFLKGS